MSESRIVMITAAEGTTAVARAQLLDEARAALPAGTHVLVLPHGVVPADPEAARVARKDAGDEIRSILREHRLSHTEAVYAIGELAERLGSLPGDPLP